MKVLFFMKTPSSVRIYESVLASLAERGHRIHLVFDDYDEFPLWGRLKAAAGAITMSQAPRRSGFWKHAAASIRGTVDYTLYLHPYFRRAAPLRRRMEGRLPRAARFLTRLPTLPAPVVRAAIGFLRALEAAAPLNRALVGFIRSQAPDAVLVTPMVTAALEQTEAVKAAKSLGIPCAVCVGSWDNLTTKGLIRVVPDKVIVWNGAQKWQASRLHAIPEDRVVATGAQLFDEWFRRRESGPAREFRSAAGLDPDRPFILFAGSTATISRPGNDVQFVLRWIAAIRASGDPALRGAGILIRPHPHNAAHWQTIDLASYGNVALWRHTGVRTAGEAEDKAMHFDESGRQGYFDSIRHSAAVVGINSSALIEAAIAGRPVLAVLAPEFREMQEGTPHFQYLLPENGGFLKVSRTLDEHLAQLSELLARPAGEYKDNEAFLREFIRPHGLERPCTPIFVEAVERLSGLRPSEEGAPSSSREAQSSLA